MSIEWALHVDHYRGRAFVRQKCVAVLARRIADDGRREHAAVAGSANISESR
jgi:hypothetical protein